MFIYDVLHYDASGVTGIRIPSVDPCDPVTGIEHVVWPSRIASGTVGGGGEIVVRDGHVVQVTGL